ncbi:response regulator [Pseudodesulfovibrio sp.]|uniref:tetratricopeptide repeat protein n=1 Tax=Pseudodesulfovibrio sp. TaxID=2035812 RepID=UPI002629348D|nr:response regulator [Pseudodesulfovibrio sp.]MDD3312428.1 tetratricopeptide repeat protein [Pseudodesulfovibrio sp.]
MYVVKSSSPDIDERHGELSTKNLYLLKSDDQAIHRYSDTVIDFVDRDGLFLVVSQDKTFFLNFRNSFCKELEIDQGRIRLLSSTKRALEEIPVYREYGKKPFLFLEASLDGRSTLPLVEEIKSRFKDMFIILLSSDADEKVIARSLETGADNFITKPVSVNILVEKVANTLEPRDEVGKMILEGKRRLGKVEFALAYGVARDILGIKPGSPAGLMIMGDALKGLCKRADALKMYLQAAENAPMYLEPLKKIVEFHKEDGDRDEVLSYLTRIDELSPLHVERKKEIGELHFERRDVAHASEYFAEAVQIMHQMKQPECVTQAEGYADRVFRENNKAARPLLQLCARLARLNRVELDGTVHNRLGMLLRQEGDWRGAVKAYTLAAQRLPDDANVLFNMGMAYVEGKDYGSAAQRFERLLRLHPDFHLDNVQAAYVMAQVLVKADRPKKAEALLQHLLAADPANPKVKALLDSLG